MSVFSLGLIILFIAAAIYYIIFFSFIFYWHLRKTSFVIVPAIFTFDFFLISFLVVAIMSIIIEYLPDLIRLLNI